MSDKKNLEKTCLDKTVAYHKNASKDTKRILDMLRGVINECEQPDFIIENDKEFFGVEHFLIDTVIGNNNSSRNRLRIYEARKTYERYHENLKDNMNEAVEKVESIAQDEIDAIQSFDYKVFIEEFKRIVEVHLNKIDTYKMKHDEITKIVFLIEIPISKVRILGLNNYYQWEEIKGRNFPLTYDMINILKNVSNKVDYTFISVMQDDYKKVAYRVYAFDNKDFEKNVKDQITNIYLRFTYDWARSPQKRKLKLEVERKEKIAGV